MSSISRSRPRGERSDYPAIAIFAFRRPDLLRLTLRSLEHADDFHRHAVHVFSDAPRANVPGDTAAVEAVRSFLRDWCAIHGAALHEADANLGLRKSIVGGVTQILAENDSVIVLEDDLILSPSFLQFMDEALEACANRDDIMQVSGYFVPHGADLPPVGLIRSPGSWGWGTWKRAWAHYRDDAQKLLDEVSAADTSAFDFRGSYAFLDALERNAGGTLDTWAVRWYASMFLKGGYAVYPSRSLTRNIGYRDDATNTSPTRTAKVFMNQPIADHLPAIDWSRLGRAETREFADALETFYRWQQSEWARPTLLERLHAKWDSLTGGDARL
jgi:hypothetical protein